MIINEILQNRKKTLPDNWQWARLGEICEFNYGSGLPSRMRQAGKVPVYGSNGIVGYHSHSLTQGPTIIIGRKGSIGQIHLSLDPCWPIDTTYYVEHTKLNVDLKWLTFWLRTLNLDELNKAAAIPGLSRNDVYALEVPLPPLMEQQRIATMLGEQMAAVERARVAMESQLELLIKLIEAELCHSLSGPILKTELNECLEEISKGVGENWKNYRVVGATRVGLAPAKENVGKTPGRYKLVDVDTIFYNPMRILLGSIAMVEDDSEVGITSPDYVVFKTRNGILNSRWFYYWLRSQAGENFIKGLTRGAVRERMLYKRLASAEIDLPPWKIQLETAHKLRLIGQMKQSIKQQLSIINLLPAVLLRRASDGEL